MENDNKTAVEKNNQTLADLIINSVSEVTGVEIEDIKCKKRKRELVNARYICYLLLAGNKEKFTHHYIGSLFNKDHSSVTSGLITVKGLIEYDRNLAKLHEEAMKKLESYIK